MSNEPKTTLKIRVPRGCNDLLRVRLCLYEWLSLNFAPAHAVELSLAPARSISRSLLERRSRRAFMLPRFIPAPTRRQKSMLAPSRPPGRWCEPWPAAHRLQ